MRSPLITFYIIYSFILGLCIGSFANVIIDRITLGKSDIRAHFECSGCSKRLTLLDLVPVLSYLLLSGRCRHCKTKKSIRYPIVELLTAILFFGMTWHMPYLQVIPLLILIFILVCISLIDIDTQEIPDSLLIFGGVTGSSWVIIGHILGWNSPTWQNALLGIAAGALPLIILDALTLLFLKKDGFGYGDVKLMAVAGIFLGWQLIFVAYVFAFLSGGIFATYLIISKKAKRGTYMAFGPFLALGIVLALWFGYNFTTLALMII